MRKLGLLLLVVCMLLSLFTGCTAAEPDTQEDTEKPAVEQTAEEALEQTEEEQHSEQIEEQAGQLYTVTYEPNYDEITSKVVEVAAGDVIPTDSIRRFGYSFTGWYLEPESTTAFVEDQTADQNLTLFAGWEAWDEQQMENMKLFQEEMTHARYIVNRQPAYAYDDAAYIEYYDTYNLLSYQIIKSGRKLSDSLIGKIQTLSELRIQLQLSIDDPEDISWYIWEGEMAVPDDIQNKEFFGTPDNEGFEPFLVPFLVEDQSGVKGNIIIQGGDEYGRNSQEEGWPIAEYFKSMGYNAFVLQHRLAPYTALDSSLDLQRSVRYLRYYADELGVAKSENIAACGFSGAAVIVNKTVQNYYGDISPSAVYSNYVSDEIDAINSDLSAAVIVYGAVGAFEGYDTTNPNIPDTFIASGTDDSKTPVLLTVELFNYLQQAGVRSELHCFADGNFGFMATDELPAWRSEDIGGSWTESACSFLDVTFGYDGE